MAAKILLATTVKWPSAARLAGAFATLGGRVEAVFPRGHILAVSRHVARAHTYSPLRPQATLAAAIGAAAPDLIVPCDDRALDCLLALTGTSPGIATLLTRSIGPVESGRTATARSRAMAVARDEGILAPLTIPVPDEAGLMYSLDAVGLPAVLKVDGCWGGEGVVFVRTPGEARAAFHKLTTPPSRLRSLARAIRRSDAHFLCHAVSPRKCAVHLQAYVPGRPATSAFACRDGEVLAALHVDVVRSNGEKGPACLIRRTDCVRMDEAVRKIARRFRFSGLYGLDFVRDTTGAPHLIEINPRATQICHLALGKDHDLAAALLGLPPRPVVTNEALIALFPQELVRDPTGAGLAGAYHDVPWDDPAALGATLGPGMVLPAGPSRPSERHPDQDVLAAADALNLNAGKWSRGAGMPWPHGLKS